MKPSSKRRTVRVVSVSIEREVKLLAPDEFELPDMSGLVSGVSGGPPVLLELDAVYFDSADLALARAGVTLRHRTGEPGPAWTLKLPARTDGARITRTEFTFDGDLDTVPAPARDLVRAYLRSRRLRRVARLHTVRTCVSLIDEDGNRAAELVDDRVSTFEGRRQTGEFHEVELELAGTHGGGRLQRAAVKRLSAAGCRAEVPTPKLVRALGDRASAPSDVAVPRLGAEPSIGELVSYVFASSVDALVRHDVGLRLGQDPEDLHQFRVAARTLRSDIRTFASVLDGEWATVLRGELDWLGSEVGRARDADVLGGRLRDRAAGLADIDAPGLDVLLAHLGEQADDAHRTMLVALRCHRYDSLLDALTEGAHAPAFASDQPSRSAESARSFVHDAARAQFRRLAHAVNAVSDRPTDAELHRVRILAKRSRYAMDAARPVFGHPAAEHASAVARLQTVLGDLHDAVVAEQWLREAAAMHPGCAVVAGQLISAERTEQARLRDRWNDTWLDADAKAVRAWL